MSIEEAMNWLRTANFSIRNMSRDALAAIEKYVELNPPTEAYKNAMTKLVHVWYMNKEGLFQAQDYVKVPVGLKPKELQEYAQTHVKVFGRGCAFAFVRDVDTQDAPVLIMFEDGT